ncbi:PucR family transcriptional regulator [Pseudonocardia phyllosphaerae]|uniref:PucR family transcriptional regulator n=1 Tax=Pseudonocardia phyllosphaerae TaxID=3390502 RepID=UPI003978C951
MNGCATQGSGRAACPGLAVRGPPAAQSPHGARDPAFRPAEDILSYDDGIATDGLQQVVDNLAQRLGRSVAVDDPQGRMVTVSRHFGDEDPLRVYAVLQRESDERVMAHFRAHRIYDWTEPGRVPAAPEIDFKARVCCPVRARGLLFGHLFLIDQDVDGWEVDAAAAAATEVGGLMYRRVILHERAQARAEELARDLIAGTARTREAAALAAVEERQVVAAEPVVALVVAPDGEPGPESEAALRTAAEHAVRDHAPGRILATVDGRRATLLLFGGAATTGTARGTATRMLAGLDRSTRAVTGIGASATGADAAYRSHDGARLAAHAAALLPDLGDVVAEAELGVLGVLLRLPRAARTAERLPDGLRRLLAQDNGDVLVGTLETYLDCCGDATRTATTLRVHRSTLYYRLGRIEALGEVSLHDGADRLALHLGVKLHRVLEAYRSRPDLLTDP